MIRNSFSFRSERLYASPAGLATPTLTAHSEEGEHMDFAGRHVLITGGTTGIGYAAAQRFLEQGAEVTITGQDPSRVAAAAERLGDRARGYAADAADPAALRDLRDTMARTTPTLDVLFANAGIAYGTPLNATEESAYDRLMDVNVKGVFFTVATFAPMMRAGGSIILNTSWLNQVGTPGLSALSASKAAVRSFARTLAAELWPQGIRVNAVSPGAIDTPIHTKTGMNAETAAQFAARIQAGVPMGRFGRSDEVADAVLFLAGERASYMLGAEIVVDGGFSQL
jgi:NAD(P)-dependent dehydrogenase (short-subunit alcohol dehydrogenase family)